MDRDAAGTYETQFVSQSDDEDNLYNVEKILDEKGRKYKVQWEGIDPATGKKWKPDWVWKTDCTDDLIADWKKEKEGRKRRAASHKSSSSASGSVTSRAPAAKSSTSTTKKPKSRLPAARPSPPVSEARSNSSAPTRTSAHSKHSSKFVVEVPTRTATKRPRESEVAAAPLSPVKRLRLDGPASPLPASPFDDDDGGTKGKKRAGPVTYKRRKPFVGKSPLAKKPTGLLASKTSKLSSRNEAGSSRAKPLYISSPEGAAKERAAASRKNQSAEQDSATEDEDSDPQLPDRLRPSKPASSKAPTTIRPATRSRRPPSPNLLRSDDPDPETFVRPHPTSSARTRPIPPRDPAVARANLRNVQRSLRGDIPEHIRGSISAQNRFPKVVTNDREKPSGALGSTKPASTVPKGNDAEAEQPPGPPSPPRSVSGWSPAKSVSFRADEANNQDGPGGEGERVMSSIESENAPTIPRSSPRRSNAGPAPPPTGSQPHSQGNSSKGTVIPDSQARAQNTNVPAESSPPTKPHAAAPTSPARAAPSKPRPSASRTRLKLRPSEMLRLGKGITIKSRPSVAETESTLIESIPPELAAAHAQAPSGSEYEPQGSPSQSPSETTESNEVAPGTPGSSEVAKSEAEEVDSNADDDDEEIGQDGPSFRTRSQSQSFSQGRPKYQPLWPDSSPARPKRTKPKEEEQAGALSQGENEEDQEEVDGPIPTSSPSLGGGRTGSMSPERLASPTRRRMTVEVVLPPLARSSQQTLSQATKSARPSQEEPVKQPELVTQETGLEAEGEGAQAPPNEDGGLENDQEGSPSLNEQDQSFAHAMEIDELLTDDASHQLVGDDAKLAAAADKAPKDADTTGSVLDLSNTTADTSGSVLDLDPDATHTNNFMDIVQPLAEPAPALPSQPDSQIPTSSSNLPQAPKATAPLAPAFLPPLPFDSSGSQRLPATQDPAPESQNLASQQLQPQSQPPSQPQERTHSSIEEPSSWSFPPPGQVPRPADTISSFTPTNPSTREPRTSGEHLLPSSNPFMHTINGDNYGIGPSHTQNSAGLGPPSTFGPVPELGTGVFTRDRSPESDIGQFDSPMKATPTFLREGSSTSPELRKARDAVLGIHFGGVNAGRVDSSGQSEKERMAEALQEAESKLAARDHRIVELTAELEQLVAEKSRAAAIFRDNMAQSEAIVQQQQEAYTTELADHAKTIADLRLQLMAAQTQSEIAESQRVAALEQYNIASNEAKSLADVNRALDDRVCMLEKQVTAGLQHWQRGFESNMERKEQELKKVQAQLDLEREIRARTDGQDIRRRAAEWYELKKRVEDLEAESLQVEQEAKALCTREKELRLREQELAQREKALENRPVPPSQSQGDRGLSQDDMQTETMLSDRSAVLADLDGPAGEDMVWMCTYRNSSDRICGHAFDTMGLLLSHVLDANGHKVDAGCQCG